MARPPSALSKFILSLPRDLLVKEVIAKARAKGLKATESNIYRVRRTFPGPGAKTSSSSTSSSLTASAPRRGRPPSAGGGGSARAEDLLRSVAAEIGLGRALEMLTAERARVKALIG